MRLYFRPVQAMANLHQMYHAQAMNHKLKKANNPEANAWAQKVVQTFRRDSILCAQYNHEMAGGKWNGMMTQKHIGYRSWNDNFRADTMPIVYAVEEGDNGGGYCFEAEGGMVAMEAPHYFKAENAQGAQWTLIPDIGRTLGGMALMPYTAGTDNGTISYKFKAEDWNADSVRIHVVVKSTLDYIGKGGLTYTISLDGAEPVRVNFNSRLNEKPENIYSVFYPTVAKRVVESVVTCPLGKGDTHIITLHPDDPAIVFEKVVVDGGGYKPAYLFGPESQCARCNYSVLILGTLLP